MSCVVVLAALIGTALAAPQVAVKPAPYQAYQPLQYSSPFNTPYSPVYKPVPYAAAIPATPVYKQVQGYANPAYVKPAQPYAAPAYNYNPQVAYNPQYSSAYGRPIAIVRQSQDDNFDGSFTYDFEAENGISSQASGYLKNPGTEVESQVIQGQFAYTSPDGTPIVTRYYADETGFHAEGSHIPAAPSDPYRTA
ncbi:Insect cuticle protein [Homalodisca vitripennis]|nr:Insect cuticle protein [Homalodisca vitripennis]